MTDSTNESSILDHFAELFGERPKPSSPRTWHALGREFRWWHICDLIEQKEKTDASI